MEKYGAELEKQMAARHCTGVHERMKQSCVGIAGLGGLGSNIAAMLARMGVGRLVLADFDVVEPSNLNRQNYFVSQLGRYKTEATAEQLRQINPFVTLEPHTVRVDEHNASELFGGCQVVCEAFDNPQSKAMLVSTLLSQCPQIKLVCGSGMAGYGSANEMLTRRKMSRLYVCGDERTEAEEGIMAPRVMICAGQQANMTVRLLMGLEEA